MTKIGAFEYCPVEFTRKGARYAPHQVTALLDGLKVADATDLFIACHGWNNDKADATALYERLFGNVSTLFSGDTGGRRVVVAGILWPSIRFADEDLIPGGGQAAAFDGFDIPDKALERKIDAVVPALDGDDADLATIKQLASRLEDGAAAQDAFVAWIRGQLPQPAQGGPADEPADNIMQGKGHEVLKALEGAGAGGPPSHVDGGAVQGGALGLGLDDGPVAGQGGAAGLGDMFSGVKARAYRFLNLATYYQMKERAGVVGAGVGALAAELRTAFPQLRMHLVGHSFGARAVTAAAKSAAFAPSSMCLLQGAFSHNAFAPKSTELPQGFFREVVTEKRVAGPIVATHTRNDKAVGLAYALASRLAGQQVAGLGDENDIYGGIGRNGAMRMAGGESRRLTMTSASEAYAFARDAVTSIQSDQFIENHGDVSGAAVANVVWSAAAP